MCIRDRDREAFARKLLQMYKDDSFHSTKFSTDRGYATSIDINIYLWKEDIEDGESVMTAEYRPVEYGKDYDVAVSYTHLKGEQSRKNQILTMDSDSFVLCKSNCCKTVSYTHLDVYKRQDEQRANYEGIY